MKDVTVRTTISADDTKDGKEFNGGRTFPFPDSLKELGDFEALYAKLAKEKNWSTLPDFMADAETGFRIRVGKEIREKARAAYAKQDESPAAGTPKAPAPVGTVL